MKFSRLVVVFALSLLVLGFSAHKAYAHFPATAGSLTAILHVEPDDYPAAGQPETLYLIFSDAANRFRLADCACNLVVSQHGKPLFSAAMAPPTAKDTIYDTDGVPFTFAGQGSYQISLAGKPLTAGQFKPFNLQWSIAVSPTPKAGSTTSGTTLLKYFAAICAVFIVLGALVFVLS